jgi:chromate reductase
LRKASTNAGLIKAIYETKDTRFFFQWVEIINFPVFNEDIEAAGYPVDVEAARQAVGKADAILFAVP